MMADDDAFVRQTADKMLKWYGPDALRFALDEAKLAEGFDDLKAAATWENIARAIRKITRP